MDSLCSTNVHAREGLRVGGAAMMFSRLLDQRRELVNLVGLFQVTEAFGVQVTEALSSNGCVRQTLVQYLRRDETDSASVRPVPMKHEAPPSPADERASRPPHSHGGLAPPGSSVCVCGCSGHDQRCLCITGSCAAHCLWR